LPHWSRSCEPGGRSSAQHEQRTPPDGPYQWPPQHLQTRSVGVGVQRRHHDDRLLQQPTTERRFGRRHALIVVRPQLGTERRRIRALAEPQVRSDELEVAAGARVERDQLDVLAVDDHGLTDPHDHRRVRARRDTGGTEDHEREAGVRGSHAETTDRCRAVRRP